MQRTYLEGMENDESVPLSMERQQEVREAMPEEMRWSEREAAGGASIIDITGMIADLEASRRIGGR